MRFLEEERSRGLILEVWKGAASGLLSSTSVGMHNQGM